MTRSGESKNPSEVQRLSQDHRVIVRFDSECDEVASFAKCRMLDPLAVTKPLSEFSLAHIGQFAAIMAKSKIQWSEKTLT